MADAEGNVLHVPGTSAKATYQPKEILASYARYTQKGVTLAQGQGLLAAGTVLYRNSSTKKYTATASGNGAAKGVLRRDVDTTDEDKLANIVMSGILKNSLLVGLVSQAITDLNGRVDADRDWFIF